MTATAAATPVEPFAAADNVACRRRRHGGWRCRGLQAAIDHPLLFRAHIARHQQLGDFQAGAKIELRLDTVAERLDERAVLVLVAVLGRLRCRRSASSPARRSASRPDPRRSLALQPPREKHLRRRVERADRQRVLGPEQLHRQSQPGADVTPRRRRFDDQRRPGSST